MRSYKEILSFLLIREQLSLGWKILFFIVCGALLYGSMALSYVRFRSVDVFGTVLSDRTDVKENAAVNYLTVSSTTAKLCEWTQLAMRITVRGEK